MSRFPHLPETFILREMNEMEAQGWEVALYPLLQQEQETVHEDAKPWLDRVTPLSLRSPHLLAANLRAWLARPRKLLSLYLRMVAENVRSPAFLIRALYIFPKAVYAAERMQAEGIAYIHAHYATHPALMAWLIHHLSGIPYGIVTHAHDIFVNQTMLPAKLRDAQLVIAISSFNRAYLTDVAADWVRTKTEVVHCGVEPERYSPPERVYPSETLEIVSVGSLQPYKGQRYLIEACAHLQARGIPFRCRIIGEGEERGRLEAAIAAHDLAPHVELLGAKTEKEVAQFLAEANCYVQPSVIASSGKMEGIPVALMEALASKLPAVATDLSGIPELVRPGETGYLVPPADPQALAAAIEEVYRDSREAARRADAGRALVEQEFDLASNVRRLSALIAAIASPPAQAIGQPAEVVC